jgi:hypothetical protein
MVLIKAHNFASISPLSRMDDVTKHHLYVGPSIGKLHVMIQMLNNHYIIRELFFGKFLTFIYFFVVISFYLKRK